MIKDRNIAKDAGINPSKILGGGGLGIGEIYHVAQFGTGPLAYLRPRLSNDNLFVYSSSNKDAIQEALDKTVDNRNDYVCVWPADADYDLESVLTMSKQSVHLVAPAGLGWAVGAPNAVRVQQNTTETGIILLNGRYCEVAGFTFINSQCVTMGGGFASGIYATDAADATLDSGGAGFAHIHHNHFGLWIIGATNSPIIFGGSNTWTRANIEYNEFHGYAENVNTVVAKVIYLHQSCTGAHCDHNLFVVGDGAEWTICVFHEGAKGTVNYNTFHESYGSDAASRGAFGAAIHLGAMTSAIGNRGSLANTNMFSGGTASHTFCDNMDAGYYYQTGVLET